MTPPVVRVRERIRSAAERAGRDPDSVGLVAATKTRTPAEIGALLADAQSTGARVDALGENRVQEALDKQDALGAVGVPWHMIGRLQTNKVRHLAGRFALVHSVDRPELVEVLARRAPDVAVLVEVNVAGETTKGGVAPPDTANLVLSAVSSGLDVRGLMTMAPLGDPVAAEAAFLGLASLRDRVEHDLGLALPELSMGMTDDFEIAVAHGATLVRVGRALFGERD